MPTLSREQLLTGRDTLPAAMLTLQAGPVTAVYDAGDLRYIRLGGQEVLRRVYAAVRDHDWETVIPTLSNVEIDVQPDHFHIRYDADYRLRDVDFAAELTISGAPDGTITFTFDGVARSTFRRNRIGFCILHPMELAGHAVEIEHVDGSRASGVFPTDIMPHQPFYDLRTLTHEVAPGVHASVRMEGDTFEMEDQRNWTDASYKTYCTPLAEPFPAQVPAGTRIQQQITIRFAGEAPPSAVGHNSAPVITLGDTRVTLPRLGLGVASHGQPLTPTERDRLRALRLDHLRVDLRFGQADIAATLRQAADEARAIDASLHVALHLTDDAEAELVALRDVLTDVDAPISVWLVFRVGEPSTTAEWVTLARQTLADAQPDALFAGGTDANFTELNRGRPPVDALDAVTYSVNPQVHAFENIDLVETLLTQAVTVESAHAFSGGLPVMVSPVTLKMRSNPNATGPAQDALPGTLPPSVDSRQMALFGAAWTVGSIRSLAEGGAASITYYQTTGWQGVIETVAGSPLPDQFPSLPGAVFPLYHIFADVADFAGGTVISVQSSAPLAVTALVLAQGERRRWLVANTTADEQTLRLPDIHGAARLWLLDETTVQAAMTDPAAFRNQSEARHARADGLTLTLRPYAVATVDAP